MARLIVALINRLIKEAKAGASELPVPENHLRTVAEHMRQTAWYAQRLSIDDCCFLIREGGVLMAGVPLKVVPKAA